MHALEGVRVVDISTMLAAPLSAMLMADFGADVIKIERPTGDPARTQGWAVNGSSLWWKLVSRNKRNLSIDLKQGEGKQLLVDLLREADVLVENFRPGKLEALGLGPEALHEINPSLVILRTTGWGQDGPYSGRPGFGTLAEAVSGFAHVTGQVDGPPTLPPFGLADGVAGYLGAYAIMVALWHREHTEGRPGQVIDNSLFEPLFALLGPQSLVYDQLGEVQNRWGNRTPFAAPRNMYQAKDGRWLALSASAEQIVARVFKAIGTPELIGDPRFANVNTRLEHVDELDALIQDKIGQMTTDEVLDAFARESATIAPVYSIAEIFSDPHYAARGSITTIEDEEVGTLRMQAPTPRLSSTPGEVKWGGAVPGRYTEEVLREVLGLRDNEIMRLRESKVVG